jgi:hypothetical protein
VMSNAVLNIEAGTVAKGASGTGTSSSAANDFGWSVRLHGRQAQRQLHAHPTDHLHGRGRRCDRSGDLPFPSRGLWGGIVLFGNARLNNPAWTTNNVSYEDLRRVARPVGDQRGQRPDRLPAPLRWQQRRRQLGHDALRVGAPWRQEADDRQGDQRMVSGRGGPRYADGVPRGLLHGRRRVRVLRRLGEHQAPGVGIQR